MATAADDAEGPASPPPQPQPPPGPGRGPGPGPGLPIRAAGCVLWRRAIGTAGGVEIALIHRPKHDDWSHPKGKLLDGETPAEAAIREVEEETGMTCRLGPSLTTARYLAKGREKEVTYWTAEVTGGSFHPNGEVDRLEWFPPPAAHARLTHPGNRALLDQALGSLGR